MATGFADFERIVQNRIRAQWTTTEIAFDNVEANELRDGQDPWVRFSILDGLSDQIGIGGTGVGYSRHVGTLTISIFDREDRGARRARGYADSIAAIWRGQEDQGVVFREPSLTPIGASGNEGWYQINVSVPYYWDLSL